MSHSPMGGIKPQLKKAALPKIATPEMDQDTDPKDIQSDPEAMECIEKLKSLGYTAEDVEQAMGSDEDQQNTTGSSASSDMGFGSNVQLPTKFGK